ERRLRLLERDVAAGHLRRRRKRRLRRNESDVARKRVHERVRRLELRERRSDEVGGHYVSGHEERRAPRLLLAASGGSEPGPGDAPHLRRGTARLAVMGVRSRYS